MLSLVLSAILAFPEPVPAPMQQPGGTGPVIRVPGERSDCPPIRAKDIHRRNSDAIRLAQTRQFEEAERVLRRVLEEAETCFGPGHSQTTVILENLASALQNLGKTAEAEHLHLRALDIVEKSRKNLDFVSVILSNLADLYKQQGRFEEAERTYLRVLPAVEKSLGPEHPATITVLSGYTGLWLGSQKGRVEEALPLFERIVRHKEKTLGQDHPESAGALYNLALAYRAAGDYTKAEALTRKALAKEEKALGPWHRDVATMLNGLAGIHQERGELGKADRLYRRVLEIHATSPSSGAVDRAETLNSMGALYATLGQFDKAREAYRRALAIYRNYLGPEHFVTLGTVHNLGSLEEKRGNFAEAETHYREALTGLQKKFGERHRVVALELSALGKLAVHLGRSAEAESLYRRALALEEESDGAPSDNTLRLLGVMLRQQGRFPEAEACLRRALELRQQRFGPDHLALLNGIEEFAILLYAQKQRAEAEAQFERGFGILQRQFEEHFPVLAERERLAYLETVADFFSTYHSFCFRFRQEVPGLVGRMYDLVLLQKGLVASTLARVHAQVAASGDKEALAKLEELRATRTRLANFLLNPSSPQTASPGLIAELQQKVNDLERDLLERMRGSVQEPGPTRITWRDVQQTLRPGEAAVEFLRFRFHDGRGWTSKVWYVALILTAGSASAPTLIELGEADKLEGAAFAEFQKHVALRAAPNDPAKSVLSEAYRSYWEPLEAALRGVSRVYLSPDGVFYHLAVGIFASGDGMALADKYDLRQVSTTRDLLGGRRQKSADTAVLIGNPRFNLPHADHRAAHRALFEEKAGTAVPSGLARGLRSRDATAAGVLGPLPGTGVEMESIRRLLHDSAWQVAVYTDTRALEEAVKNVRNPRVLHLATHGFFLADQGGNASSDRETPSREDPMLRSGLFFAGAENALLGEEPQDELEDGVLTAFEATGLSLQGTELVVLSACDTGLGQVRNGEGVFGLRRAFQVAGAEAVLMSLWSVPDRETQELMTFFYQKWLAGEDKHRALRMAQREMRDLVQRRYGRDLPFYWGGFVLVGR